MKIKGFCPICGHPDPEVGPDAFLRCTGPECPSPDAIAEILLDNELHHIVNVDDNGYGWTIRHPLRERIRGQLFDCRIYGVPVHQIVAERIRDLPLKPGLHRLIDESKTFNPADPFHGGGPWGWEHLS